MEPGERDRRGRRTAGAPRRPRRLAARRCPRHGGVGAGQAARRTPPGAGAIREREMDKVVATAEQALADVTDSLSFAVGGFGLSGVPEVLIGALYETGADGLTVVSNNCGVDGRGLGILLAAGRVARVTGSYIGENKEFA